MKQATIALAFVTIHIDDATRRAHFVERRSGRREGGERRWR